MRPPTTAELCCPWLVLAAWALGPGAWAAIVLRMLPWAPWSFGLVAATTTLAAALAVVAWLTADGRSRLDTLALRSTFWLTPVLFLLQPVNVLGGPRYWHDAMAAALSAAFLAAPAAAVAVVLAQGAGWVMRRGGRRTALPTESAQPIDRSRHSTATTTSAATTSTTARTPSHHGTSSGRSVPE